MDDTKIDLCEGEIIPVDNGSNFEKVRQAIADMTVDEKAKITKELLPGGVTVILGGNNVVNNSFAFQLNGSADELSEKLKEIPAEQLGELLKAIALRIQADSLIKPDSES